MKSGFLDNIFENQINIGPPVTKVTSQVNRWQISDLPPGEVYA